MKHLLFIFHLISINIGISLIILLYIFYKSKKNKILKTYILFLSSLTLLYIYHILFTYNNIVLSFKYKTISIIIYTIGYITRGFCLLTLPLFCYTLYNFKINKLKLIIITIIECFLIFMIFYHAVNIDKKDSLLINFIQYIFEIIFHIYFLMYFLRIHINKIQNIYIKKYVNLFSYFSIIFIPLMFIDEFIKNATPLSKYLVDGIIAFPIFYFLWNTICLISIINDVFINLLSPERLNKLILKQLSKDYNLTNTENAVIKLLIKGKSNKEISADFYKSVRTIDNHIYNIFKKINIQSRYELIDKIEKYKEISVNNFKLN